MGDVDLWSVAPDGTSLTVNAKWLQHLQERLLGEDGHPRKVRCCWSDGVPVAGGLLLVMCCIFVQW
jgi:hypothetical protein